jgi:hypothetical protein
MKGHIQQCGKNLCRLKFDAGRDIYRDFSAPVGRSKNDRSHSETRRAIVTDIAKGHRPHSWR